MLTSRFTRLLTKALVLPIFPALGVEAPPTPSDTGAAPAGVGVPPSVTIPAGDPSKTEPKTFTQEEVNRMTAAEKEQGRRAALAALGIDASDETKAKEAITAYKAYVDSQKTDLEKAQSAATTALQEKQAAEQKAVALQSQLDALTLGVNPTHLEDILAIASAKVTKDKDFKAVVTEMKANAAYATFFSTTTEDPVKKAPVGTGTIPGSKKPLDNTLESAAKRLADKRSKAPAKSHYFNN